MNINTSQLLALPLHVWDRELDARLFLACMAAKLGYSSIIGHEYNIAGLYKNSSSLFYYGAGRPIFDQTRTCQWYEPLINSGGQVSLVFEEGLNDISDSSSIYTGITSRSLKACNSIYTWHVRESVQMKQVTDRTLHVSLDEKCVPCLNTRFEMLGNIGRSYYSGKANAISDIFGQYILISDNFGIDVFTGGTTLSSLDLNSKNIGNLKIKDSKKEELKGFYHERHLKSVKSRELFCATINCIASAFPDINFVFRPHPIASPEYWYSNLRKLRNLSIIYKGSVEPWIYSSKAVIHAGCTTGLQAELAGVPAVDISQMYDDMRNLGISTPLSRFSPSTMKDLQKILSDLADVDKFKPKDLLSDINFTVNNLLDVNIGSINSDVLLRMKTNHSLDIPLVSNTSHLLRRFADFASSASVLGDKLGLSLAHIDDLLGSQPPLPSKSRWFNAKDISSRIDSICRTLNIRIKVVEFKGKNVFLLTPPNTIS